MPTRDIWSAPVVLGIVGLYLALNYLLRLALGGALGFDDAEQALFAQSFEPGYRVVQPPLYTWLLLAAFELFGVHLWTVILPRYLLLAITFAALYAVGRMWIGDRRCAALAVFAYALIYVFAYYAHHDLTHTTGLGAGVALTFLAFALIVREPANVLAYAGLGAAAAVGLLGKWNFVLLAIGLPLACLAHPPFRHLVWTWRSLVALAVAAVLCLPTGLWLLSQEHGAGEVMTSTLQGSDSRFPLIDGTIALAGALLLFPMPFLAIVLPLFGPAMLRGWRDARRHPPAGVTPAFLVLLIGIVAALHWLLVPLLGAESFTARWMHPVLMVLPILVFQLIARGDPDWRAVRAYLALVVVAVLLVVGVRVGRHLRGAEHCGKCREMAPFEELAGALREQGFSRGTIVADGWHLAGNLRLQFPDARVLEPRSDRSVLPDRPDDGGCLAVWRIDGEAEPGARARVMGLLEELSIPERPSIRYGEVEGLMHRARSRTYRLGYAHLADGGGDCR